MTLTTRTLTVGILTALLVYGVLTAPVQAAEFTRGLLEQLALAARSGRTFLQHLAT